MRRLLAGLTACSVLAIPATALRASANTEESVSGSFLELGPLTITADHPTPAGGEELDSYHPIVYTGGFSGQSTSYEHTVISPKGTFETHNVEFFTGTVTAQDGTVLGTGTLTINFNAQGDFTSNGGAGQFTAHWQVIASGGGLSGLHGSGTAMGEPGVPGGNGIITGTLG